MITLTKPSNDYDALADAACDTLLILGRYPKAPVYADDLCAALRLLDKCKTADDVRQLHPVLAVLERAITEPRSH